MSPSRPSQHHHHHANHRTPLSTSLVNPGGGRQQDAANYSSSNGSMYNPTTATTSQPPPPPSRGTASQLAAARPPPPQQPEQELEQRRKEAYDTSRNLRQDSLPQHFQKGIGDEASSSVESSTVIRRPKATPKQQESSQDAVPRRPKGPSQVSQGTGTSGTTGTWSSKRHGMYLQQASHLPPHQSVRASIAVMNVPDEGSGGGGGGSNRNSGIFNMEATEAKPPLPPAGPAEGAQGTAGGAGSGPRPPPRTRPKSWTSSLFNAMSRQGRYSIAHDFALTTSTIISLLALWDV